MQDNLIEELEKAEQTAKLLMQDVRAAHKKACSESPLMAHCLLSVIKGMAGIEAELSGIIAAAKDNNEKR